MTTDVLAAPGHGRPLVERVDEIIKQLEQYPPTGLMADNAFFDDVSGDA